MAGRAPLSSFMLVVKTCECFPFLLGAELLSGRLALGLVLHLVLLRFVDVAPVRGPGFFFGVVAIAYYTTEFV